MLNPFKKKSVTGILSVFTKCVSELRDLADARMLEAARKDTIVRDLMAQIEADEAESEAALEAADAIEGLIGTGHPAFEATAERL
jgi:hypothetical protein